MQSTEKPMEIADESLDNATGGQTREHVLLSRQVGVPYAASNSGAKVKAGADPMDLKRGID